MKILDITTEFNRKSRNSYSKNMSIVKYHTGSSLANSIQDLLEPLGNISNFISKNDKVFLKPNFNTGDPFPASTDPEFLLGVIEVVQQQTNDISIIESSTIRADTHKIINEKVGSRLQDKNIPIITEKEIKYTKINLKPLGAKYQSSVLLPKNIFEPHIKLILLPCLKTHFIAEFTGALKLVVGLMERKQRIKMHMSLKVPEKIAELNLGYSPDLIIMDARKIFVTGGPAKGKLESPMKLIAGLNRTNIDIEGAKIIQSYGENNKLHPTDPLQVRTIKRALDLNII